MTSLYHVLSFCRNYLMVARGCRTYSSTHVVTRLGCPPSLTQCTYFFTSPYVQCAIYRAHAKPHSVTLQLLLLYHCRNVGLGLCRSERHIHYQTLRVHTWCMAVLLHPPSCSTNSPCGTTAIFFFFYYLSSRRQPTLPPPSPTSAPSRFSLYKHVRSPSGTPTYAVHLRVLPPPHLRRRGRGVLRFNLSFLSSSGTPTFEVQDPVVPTVFYTLR